MCQLEEIGRYRGTKAETIGLLWDAISVSE